VISYVLVDTHYSRTRNTTSPRVYTARCGGRHGLAHPRSQDILLATNS